MNCQRSCEPPRFAPWDLLPPNSWEGKNVAVPEKSATGRKGPKGRLSRLKLPNPLPFFSFFFLSSAFTAADSEDHISRRASLPRAEGVLYLTLFQVFTRMCQTN